MESINENLQLKSKINEVIETALFIFERKATNIQKELDTMRKDFLDQLHKLNEWVSTGKHLQGNAFNRKNGSYVPQNKLYISPNKSKFNVSISNSPNFKGNELPSNGGTLSINTNLQSQNTSANNLFTPIPSAHGNSNINSHNISQTPVSQKELNKNLSSGGIKNNINNNINSAISNVIIKKENLMNMSNNVAFRLNAKNATNLNNSFLNKKWKDKNRVNENLPNSSPKNASSPNNLNYFQINNPTNYNSIPRSSNKTPTRGEKDKLLPKRAVLDYVTSSSKNVIPPSLPKQLLQEKPKPELIAIKDQRKFSILDIPANDPEILKNYIQNNHNSLEEEFNYNKPTVSKKVLEKIDNNYIKAFYILTTSE